MVRFILLLDFQSLHFEILPWLIWSDTCVDRPRCRSRAAPSKGSKSTKVSGPMYVFAIVHCQVVIPFYTDMLLTSSILSCIVCCSSTSQPATPTPPPAALVPDAGLGGNMVRTPSSHVNCLMLKASLVI